MTVHGDGSMATHFGRQVRKERVARGWTLRELSARSGVDFSHLSRIESGRRPPTEAIADAMDRTFPERRGWFREFYDDAKSAMPPGLRSWTEIEDRAARLAVWCPGTIHGLLQTEAYARAMLSTLHAPAEVVDARLAARSARQRRVLHRADPPAVVAIIDHPALYRGVGSPSVVAEQCRHLLGLAARPRVTLQVLPPVAHPATASELIIADDAAAYAEHLAAGGVYTEAETVARLGVIMATIRGECYRASDSAAIIGKAGELWTGASRRSAARTGRVSRRPRARA